MMTTSKLTSNTRMLSAAMLRLLPIQVLMLAVASLNSLISGWFAANYIGESAMSAVGMFSPVQMLIGAVGTVLAAGAAILCGEYAGMNEQKKLQSVFTVNIASAASAGAVIGVMLFLLGSSGMTGFFTTDPLIKPAFDSYIRVMAAGVLPYMVMTQIPSYLIMDNRNRRAMAAGIAFALSNVVFNVIFVCVMRMGTAGLALASVLGAWVCLAVEAEYFIRGASSVRFSLNSAEWKECPAMVKIGFPGGATYIYQSARGYIVNRLILMYAGSDGLAAFTAVNSFLIVFWAIPAGMLVVSRMMISVSIGEEDRQTLTDVMRVMFGRFLPLQCAVSAVLCLAAVPLTNLFFHVPQDPVFMMTVWGFRLLPLCMPFSVIYLHFTCYYQASGREKFANFLAVLDGAADVVIVSLILMPLMGMNGVYIANIANGVITVALIFVFACVMNRRLPRNMEELMVIPDGFGAAPEDRMAFTVRTPSEIAGMAEEIQRFCTERGTDERKAYAAGLAMEEIAENIVEHGFARDSLDHSIDVRVVHRGEGITMLIKDDCIAFDPLAMREIEEKQRDEGKLGLRLIFGMAQDVQYQNILGLNILTIRI